MSNQTEWSISCNRPRLWIAFHLSWITVLLPPLTPHFKIGDILSIIIMYILIQIPCRLQCSCGNLSLSVCQVFILLLGSQTLILPKRDDSVLNSGRIFVWIVIYSCCGSLYCLLNSSCLFRFILASFSYCSFCLPSSCRSRMFCSWLGGSRGCWRLLVQVSITSFAVICFQSDHHYHNVYHIMIKDVCVVRCDVQCIMMMDHQGLSPIWSNSGMIVLVSKPWIVWLRVSKCFTEASQGLDWRIWDQESISHSN